MDIIKQCKKETAMLVQWRQLNSNRDYQFLSTQIVETFVSEVFLETNR